MSNKCLKITEKVTSDLWNNSAPDLWHRGTFANSIDFDLCQCNRNIPSSQMCLSLIGYGAPNVIIYFKNQIRAKMLSYPWHSAASHSHLVLGGLQEFCSISSSFLWVLWSLTENHPGVSTSSYHLQWKFAECPPLCSNFLAPESFLWIEMWPTSKSIS